jgi:SP family facilitated glucose transporter-like MFS transporter 3
MTILSGLITSVMPMYLTELAPRPLRGPMGVLCPLGVTFGVLVGQVLSLSQILGTAAVRF